MFDFESPAPADRARARFLVYQSGQLVCNLRADPPCVFGHDELQRLQWQVEREQFLGHHDGRAWFALALAPGEALDPMAFSAGSLYQLLGRVDDPVFALAGRGAQLLRFAEEHRFCSRCGQPMQALSAERALGCAHCERTLYPPLAPCIIVLVSDGDRMLLARSARFPRPMYSTLAGFVEAGESAEQCLQREVREEVGVEVRNIRYFGSQAWPFPNQLMLGYFAEYAGGELRCDPSEIADAGWFERDALPPIPPAVSISGQLIRRFMDELR
jgi:NAD+ diphosphatase